MDFKLASACSRVIDKREQLNEALSKAEEALTDHVERILTELAERYPRRRFVATSGMGSLSIDVYPGPRPTYSHHARLPYQWTWGVMCGADHQWRFLWQDWEDLLDSFIEATGQTANDYVNFSREVDVRGRLYKG